MKLTEILPNLFVRGHLRRVTDLPTELRADAIDVVIGLVNPPQPVSASVEYVCAPMADGLLRPATRRRVEELSELAAARWRAGKRVLIYCNAGRNRSCLVASLAVAKLRGCSRAAALEWVRQRRPRAVANAEFERYLTGDSES